MKIAVCVRDPLYTTLSRSLANETVHKATNWAQLRVLLRTEAIDAAIIDPLADGILNEKACEDLLVRFAPIPIIAYTTADPEVCRVLVCLAKCGLQDVVIFRFDDSADSFHNYLSRLRGSRHVEQLIRSMGRDAPTSRLQLLGVIREILEDPSRFECAESVAIRVGLSRGRLSRTLGAAGVASAKKLIVAGRLLKAVVYLKDSSLCIEDIAKILGYSKKQIMIAQFKNVFGKTPADVRKHLHMEAVLRDLNRWMVLAAP